MFNQKVNGNVSQNPEYLNQAYSLINPVTVHNCGTTINKYVKASNSSSLPLQKWAGSSWGPE